MRAVCYARVSSQSQRERDTIASQLRVLPEFVERQGWQLTKPVGTYVDDGRTAKAGHLEARTGLSALLRDAAAGLFDVVVVVDLDRLTRSEDIAERGAILGALQRAGVRVASSTSGQVLDLSTSVGDLFSTLQAFFAAEENRKRRERIVQGKVTAAARGRKPAGPTPFGLAYERATGVWSIDPVRGPIVREAFERVAAGASCQELAHDFEVRVLPSPRGHWQRALVYQIVTKRYAVGEWTADRRRRLVIKVPAIVDEEMWLAAQNALRANGKRGLIKTKHVYLLEGLAVCAACGSRIGIRSAVTNMRGYRNPAAYVCDARKLRRACNAPIVRCHDLDARVWEALMLEIARPELVDAVIADRQSRIDNPRDWKADAEGYRRHLARLERATHVVIERERRELITEATLDAELATIQRERSAVLVQLATAERAAAVASEHHERISDAKSVVEELRQAMPGATPKQRQELIRALVEPGGAVLDNGRIRLSLILPVAERKADLPLRAVDYRKHHEATLRLRLVA